LVERFFDKIEQIRQIAARYEAAPSFAAMLFLIRVMI
jgi:transposase